MNIKSVLVVVVAVLALAGIVWWNWSVFSEVGFSMPVGGWIALGLGTIFSLIIGIGLMFLIFYSSRRGYDEAPEREQDEPPRPPPPESGNLG